MKWSRKTTTAASVCAALLAAASLTGSLPEWIQNIDVAGGLEAVFFTQAQMPSGPVPVRRPPRETRPELTKLIAAKPASADLYSLRALEAEQQLDFAAAEADWRKYSELAADKAAGGLALADYYHRRLRPEDEIAALGSVARMPLPESDTRPVAAFSRIFALVRAQALPADLAATYHRAWIARSPGEAAAYRAFFDFALSERRFADAEEAVAGYARQFPKDDVFPLSARAALAERRGSADDALALYDRALRPQSSAELVKDYFELLKRTRNLRVFLERSRAALATNPDDLNAAARLFFYYQQQGDPASAQRALVEFRLRKESRKSAWAAGEHLALAALLEGAHSYDEAARAYYGAWTPANAPADAREQALAGLVQVLLAAPDQPIQLGRGDLSFYRDIATMDPYPGFLNGLLSLVLNTTAPGVEYNRQEHNAVAYFHRAKAAELVALFDAQFPKSSRRAGIHAALIETYAIYGDSDGVIRRGQAFLAGFPVSELRANVSLRVAEAHARKNQTPQEFAVYDALLKELAAQAQGMPLGEIGEGIPRNPGAEQPDAPQQPPKWKPARSPEYARVLDRYIARLVSLKRLQEALALYRREIDRNPNDPGLYERLAAFLDQNKLTAEIEQVYRRAIGQFPDTNWYHKLARWYLRRKQTAQFDQVTQSVVKVFSGADLGRYFREVVATAPIDAQLYLKVNLYAWQRFPWKLAFVKNLLNAYGRRETWNPAASEQLLRRYWFHDDELRARFFELLTRTRRLDAELAALQKPGAPAANQFVAEAEAWRSHFEEAAPAFRSVAAEFPADLSLSGRAAAVHRSLAAFDPRNTEIAAGLEQNLHRAAPRDAALLARVGDVYADREQFDRARPFWNQMAEIEPGKADGYLGAATVFWDYYLFDDALRLLAEGRTKLKRPELYAYQYGAIRENQRDYARAVQEYAQDAGAGASAARLVTLSKRAATRELVESATSALAAGASPSPAAVRLRVAVLDAQNRREDTGRFLAALAAGTSSAELLSEVDRIAQEQSLDAVHEGVLARQIALMRDPVEKLRLRLDLARFYESKGDAAKAGQAIDAVLGENPAILGVVRAATDFHWRNKNYTRAVDVLERAAAIANPRLKTEFTFEAARKAADSAQYGRARMLLARLLESAPYQAEYLAAVAETYALEGNDRELRAFYSAKIAELQKAPLAPEEKTARSAALRRGYIPVLTRVKDFTAALDQYIEVVNRYPEDETLAGEVAQYAGTHNLKDRLLGAYTKTAAESPRDYRWQVVLARLGTNFEDFNGAVAAYTKAIAIRPDRLDLYSARASLEVRLMRFDEAAATYTKLYDLAYRNPEWMEKLAEVRARQRRNADAVKALEKAFLEGRPPRPESFFTVAQKLETWDMLAEARGFAEKGVDLAGKDLAAFPEYVSGMQTYARIVTRLGEFAAAWDRIVKVVGIQNANPGLQAIATAIRQTAPEAQKTAFRSFLDAQRSASSLPVFLNILLPLAQQAGLVDLEARWRYEALMLRPGAPESAMNETRLVELQSARMRFDELGAQLEAYWHMYPNNDQKSAVLARAAKAYRSGGNEEAELRVLATAPDARYLELLAKKRAAQLVTLAGQRNWHDPVNAALRWGDGPYALRAIEAHGRSYAPVWTKSYTALAGLHFVLRAPEVMAAFTSALGPQAIGERIGRPVDRNQQLAGNTWFYYGSRFGEYLAATKQGNAEDYLAAMLEGAPGNAENYWQLGEYYREANDAPRALAEYGYALQLDPLRGAAHDHAAELLWAQGKREEATARWKESFAAFARLQDARRLPPEFWSDVRGALENVGRRGLLAQVRADADRVLRTYIRRNGGYRVEPLLRGAFAAGGAVWMVEVSRAANDPGRVLEQVIRARWIPEEAREPVYQAILATKRQKAADARGEEKMWRESDARGWQMRWIEWLLDTKQTERARNALDALPQEERKAMRVQAAQVEIRAAAQAKTLDRLLERYRNESSEAPGRDVLLASANVLRANGDAESARRVLDFHYTRELAARNLDASNFLGLAEVRLEQGNTGEALALLRRAQLVCGEPFESLMAAARLLEKNGKRAEALEFANARVQAVPWDREASELQAKLKAPARPSAAQGDAQTLLRAISAAPEDQSLRIPLFRALVAAGRQQLAISAVWPLIERGGLNWSIQNSMERTQREEESYEDEGGGRSYLAEQFLSGMGLGEPERASLAVQLAGAYEALDELRPAALLLGIAQGIQPAPAIAVRTESLNAHAALRAENERRRPVAGENIEQPRIVRPRLAALPGGAQ